MTASLRWCRRATRISHVQPLHLVHFVRELLVCWFLRCWVCGLKMDNWIDQGRVELADVRLRPSPMNNEPAYGKARIKTPRRT